MLNKDLSVKINCIAFLLCLFFTLMIPWDHSLWTGFGDPPDYLTQSTMSLLDKEFYFPHKAPNFYPRPFTVPLFYKIANTNVDLIIQLQKFVHCLSVFLLVHTLLLVIDKIVIKYLLIVFMYSFMSWWNILGWANLVLSESLSMALLFCWIASFIIFYKRRTWSSVIFHILITILFSFTRDSWPYIICSFYLINIFISFFQEKIMLRKYLILLVFGIIVFFVQQHAAQVGQRYRLPLINNIVVRILPDKNHLEWFVQQGMPCSQELEKNYSGLSFQNNNLHNLYNLYNDSAYLALFNWINIKGQMAYTKFLITHPAYTFFLEEDTSELNRIFAFNLNYPKESKGYSQMIDKIFPLFSLPITIILIFLSLILYFFEKRGILLLPLSLGIVFALNVLLSYNADSLEVERHLFITNIMMQFLGIIGLALIADAKIIQNSVSRRPQLKFLFPLTKGSKPVSESISNTSD